MKAQPYIVLFEIGSTKLRAAFARRDEDGQLHLADLQEKEGCYMHRGLLENVERVEFDLNHLWLLLSNSCDDFGQAYLCLCNDDDENLRKANAAMIEEIIGLHRGSNRELVYVGSPLKHTVEALTSQEERQKGCLYLDFGAGHTHVQCYYHNKSLIQKSLPVGGDDITNDIASDVEVSLKEAEMLKVRQGNAVSNQVKKAYIRFVQPNTGQTKALLNTDLANRIEDRLTTDCIQPYLKALKGHGFFDRIPMDIVLSGGASQMKGLELLLQNSCPQAGIRRADASSLLAGEDQKYNRPEYHSLLGLLQSLTMFEPPKEGLGRFFRRDPKKKKEEKKKKEPTLTPGIPEEKTKLDKKVDNLMDAIYTD
ncbi:MAG: rod shape-determining protein [Paludibacteraceae bacterium]|nr:rod shape-determining protein [Paludibacteraceae bacterium]